MTGFLDSLAQAIRFLTLVPVPATSTGGGHDITRSLHVFPIVGLLIGAVSTACGLVAQHLLGEPLHIAAALAASAVVTAGFHLDGLADSCDALFSWRARERKLEIMRDSRIGAMGVIALILDFMLKAAALAALGPWWWVGALLAPVWGRWADIYGIVHFPVARPDGLASDVGRNAADSQFWTASVFTLAATLPFVYFGVATLLLGIAAAILVIHWSARAMVKSLGGLTGDTYGALCEIGEILCLLVLCFVLL